MAAPEPLSAVDAAWLRLDRPTNLMMICGMMLFDGRVDLAALRELIRTRLLCFHRFRQRVADAAATPYWETDADFDLDWHVRRIIVPAGATLEQTTSELVSTALDPGKPLWQFHLVDGAHGSALVLRVHHCYGDGFALLHVVDAITDLAPAHPRAPASDVGAGASARSALERIVGAPAAVLGDALRGALSLAGAGAALLSHPARAVDALRRGADLAYQAAVIAAMAPDARTRLKGRLGVMKRVAWAAPLPLAEVKAVAAALDCSVNDVLLACIAGALGAYLREHGEEVADADLRALVPVNLRPPGPLTELGNRFGMVFLSLPVGIDDPLERLAEVHRRMGELKHSAQPLVALAVLAAMGMVPAPLKERVLAALAENASVIITNVHGAESARFLAGRRIVRQMFWVPQSGGIGLGISILSYAGQVSFGVLADAGLLPDAPALAPCFADQFEALLLTTLMLPWPGHAGTPHRHR